MKSNKVFFTRKEVYNNKLKRAEFFVLALLPYRWAYALRMYIVHMQIRIQKSTQYNYLKIKQNLSAKSKSSKQYVYA